MQQTLVNSVLIWYDLSTESLLVGTKTFGRQSGLLGQNLKTL